MSVDLFEQRGAMGHARAQAMGRARAQAMADIVTGTLELGAMVIQLRNERDELRTALRGLMTAYAACNGTDHPAYAEAEKALRDAVEDA